jgi:hypothetical protein
MITNTFFMTKKTIIVDSPDLSVSVEYWREQFAVLHKRAGTYTLKNLVPFDTYFMTSEGKSAMSNVRAGIAGIVPTMRVCKALEKLCEFENPKRAKATTKLMSNQKLQSYESAI